MCLFQSRTIKEMSHADALNLAKRADVRGTSLHGDGESFLMRVIKVFGPVATCFKYVESKYVTRVDETYTNSFSTKLNSVEGACLLEVKCYIWLKHN